MYGPSQFVALPVGPATAGIDYALPGGELTEIRALAFVLDTAGGGAARQVVVQLEDGTGEPVYAVAAPATQAGGLTVTYSFAPLVPMAGSAALGTITGPLLGYVSGDPSRLVVSVVSASAGDSLLSGRLTVCQYDREQG